MKAAFTFDLPEDREEYSMYRQAPAMHSALWDMAQEIRQKVKYGDENELVSWDAIREWFNEHTDGVEL